MKKKGPTRKLKAIDDETLEMLKAFIIKNKIEPTDFVFKINRFQEFYLIRKIAKMANIHYIGEKRPHPHHFRHSFAVNIIKNSTKPQDLRILQQILEHSKLDITAQYLQFSQEDQRKMINRAFKDEENDILTTD